MLTDMQSLPASRYLRVTLPFSSKPLNKIVVEIKYVIFWRESSAIKLESLGYMCSNNADTIGEVLSKGIVCQLHFVCCNNCIYWIIFSLVWLTYHLLIAPEPLVKDIIELDSPRIVRFNFLKPPS